MNLSINPIMFSVDQQWIQIKCVFSNSLYNVTKEYDGVSQTSSYELTQNFVQDL